MLALVEGNTWGWGSPKIVSLLVVSALALPAFVAIERRSRAPMVDFSFFRSRSFLGANLVAFIVSFAMLAMFFFIALYMQNILRYSPLEAGVRFLPATLILIVLGPLVGRLVDRIGARTLMAAGLLAVSVSLYWQSRITVHTGYGHLLPAFVLMGFGMGLVMSPMSTAAMNAVEQTKAGVASGILSMSRMVGGTFGIAVLGALVSTLGRSRLDHLLPQATSGQRAKLAESLGSGGGSGHMPAQVTNAVHDAFVHALGHGLRLSAAVAFVGAIVAFALVDGQPAHARMATPGPTAPVRPEPEPAREPAAV